MRCHVASLKLELGKKLISVLRYGTIGEPYMVTPKVWIHIYVQGLFVPRSSSSERWFLFYRKCKELGKMSCLYIREVCVFSHVVHTDYASGGIWKRKFSAKKAWNVFRPHYAGEIWKEKLHRGDHMIIVSTSFSKSCVFKVFPSTPKQKVGVLKFLQFQLERFRSESFVFMTD